MRHSLTILGSNSAIPANNRYPTCQYLKMDTDHMLIDCGEGAQFNMSRYGVKPGKISTVFISHLHGDHIFGLPGFLTSMALSGRTKDLCVFGPVGIEEYIQTCIGLSGSRLSYSIVYKELAHQGIETIHDTDTLSVSAFPMQHRIPTYGYRFDQKQERPKVSKSAIEKYKLDIPEIKNVKNGIAPTRNGVAISLEDVTIQPVTPVSYSYCSDTIYDEALIPFIKESTLLYHEATYLHELSKQARERMHSTAHEAATIANMSNVNQLIIGHYSSRYKLLDPLLEEAKMTFPNSQLAIEGAIFEIK